MPFDIEVHIEWDDLEHIQKEQQVQLLQTHFLKLGVIVRKFLNCFIIEKKLDDIVIALGYDNKDVVKVKNQGVLNNLEH